MIPTVTTVRDLRATLLSWRESGDTISFVPTMGALHKGHLKLIEEARKVARRSIAYIFVNPMQFGPNEDLAKYPRTIENDKKLLAESGCDLLYAPTVDEIYPQGFVTKIDPGPLATIMEGTFRPQFFYGVATVVAKMLLQVMPDVALFGEKDYQQLLVIRRIVRDLDIPVHIAGIPTVREEDGLALSSRNAYLSLEERKRASALPRILIESAEKIQRGAAVADTLKVGREKLIEAGFASVDYLELADADTLAPLQTFSTSARLFVAARVGSTRLIDNVPVDINRELK